MADIYLSCSSVRDIFTFTKGKVLPCRLTMSYRDHVTITLVEMFTIKNIRHTKLFTKLNKEVVGDKYSEQIA